MHSYRKVDKVCDTSIFNDIEQVNKDQDIVNDREKQDITNFLEDKIIPARGNMMFLSL